MLMGFTNVTFSCLAEESACTQLTTHRGEWMIFIISKKDVHELQRILTLSSVNKYWLNLIFWGRINLQNAPDGRLKQWLLKIVNLSYPVLWKFSDEQFGNLLFLWTVEEDNQTSLKIVSGFRVYPTCERNNAFLPFQRYVQTANNGWIRYKILQTTNIYIHYNFLD